MLADYDTKAEVKKAAEALNIDIIFEELRNVNIRFVILFLQHTEKEATVKKVDSHPIRKEINKQD